MKYILFFLVLLFSCNEKNDTINNSRTFEEIQKEAKDSIIKDSLNTIELINNLKINKSVKIDSIKVDLIEKAKFINKLKYEFEYTSYATYFREAISEKDERILYIKIKLSTDLKPYEPKNFFPKINVFEYLDKNKKIEYYGDMSYNLINKTDLNILYLEQLFNYKDSHNFICFIRIPKDRKGKLLITVDKAQSFNKNHVIDVINN